MIANIHVRFNTSIRMSTILRTIGDCEKTCHLEDTAANLLTSRIGGMNRRDLKSHFRTGHVRMTLQGINNGG